MKTRLKLTGKKVSFAKTRWRKKKRRQRRRVLFFCLLGLPLILLVIALVAIYLWLRPLLANLPSPDDVVTSNERFSVVSQIFDRHGNTLYELFDDERRLPVKLKELPAYVAQASIAIEDKKFYSHFGFDPLGILRAFIINRTRGELAQGGSTITQQLMKKAFLSEEKSYDRKIKEIILAIIAESRYSKDQILEMYLNYISYGGTAVGIGSAAETYFNKNAQDLSLAEASFLAGLPQAPSRYSPFKSDRQEAKNRQKEVLKNMVEMGFISKAQADEAFGQELNFTRKTIDLLAPHFVFYVRDLLIAKYGEEKVYRGGLRVTTSLDLDMQRDAQASVSAQIATLARLSVGNGAALITNPSSGEIYAMVGSKDYDDIEQDGQVNITTSMQQPGSSIKPLVYATAFEQRLLNPGSVLLDVPTCFQNIGERDYCPKNYTGGFNGPTSVRQALGSSLNIPAVKAIRIIGLESFIDQANKLGIESWQQVKNYGWSLSLGGGEVKMTEMATAFGTFANQGIKVPLTPILKIEDYQGNILWEANIEQKATTLAQMQANPEISQQELANGDKLERVLQPESAFLISDILRDDKARYLGFGANSTLVIKNKDVAVKTGTTNDIKDNWTIGYTPKLLTAVWVGNTDDKPMNQRLVSGVTGAAPIWHDLMTHFLKNESITWSDPPETVKKAAVCWSGMPEKNTNNVYDDEGKLVASGGCGNSRNDFYWTQSNPTRSTLRNQTIQICSETGLPPVAAKPGEEPAPCSLTEGECLIAQDPLLDFYCTNCPRPTDENGKTIYEKPYLVLASDYARQYGD